MAGQLYLHGPALGPSGQFTGGKLPSSPGPPNPENSPQSLLTLALPQSHDLPGDQTFVSTDKG